MTEPIIITLIIVGLAAVIGSFCYNKGYEAGMRRAAALISKTEENS